MTQAMNKAMNKADEAMPDDAARRALKDDLARFHCRVHQSDDPPIFTRAPAGAMVTTLWRWADLKPLLERIGADIAIGSGGQRRTLRLTNPGFERGTTHTFWASIQVIMPGEIAEAHRHSANALRFIMHGQGCSTTVDGERYPMNQGDLVLTPGGCWHDHEHQGQQAMIWLDILDLSLMHSLDASFFEPHAAPTQPLGDTPERSWRTWGSGIMRPPGAVARPGINPLWCYPREQALAALEQAAGLPGDAFDDVILEYCNPANGGAALTTLAMTLQRLRPGFAGRARRHVGSKLYWVVSGCGTTVVDGQAFDWSAGDFLAIRPWAWHAHRNASPDTDAVLFQVNDTPVMKALGYYREQAAGADDAIGTGTGTNSFHDANK